MSGSRRKRGGGRSSADEECSTRGGSASVSGYSSSSSATVYPVQLSPAVLNKIGNDCLVNRDYNEALRYYEEAIAITPDDCKLHCNRAGALIGLMRYPEAMAEFELAINLAPRRYQPRHDFGLWLLSLGQVENATDHLYSLGHKPDEATSQKLEAVKEHINKCTEARIVEDWATMKIESKAAFTSGADSSPQLFACRAEAHLKLNDLEYAETWIYIARMHKPFTARESKIFGMVSEAYVFFVQAQIHSSVGKFAAAVTAIEKAAQIDNQNAEVTDELENIRLVVEAHKHGDEHFCSERYEQACTSYGEGLWVDSSNPVLYYNRANCWSKLGEWEKSLADSNRALLYWPQYAKALHLRAASNIKLKRWADAVRDYEILRQELPRDQEVAANLSHARAELRREAPEGKVELVSDVEKFQAVIASGESVVYFNELTNPECAWMSSVMDTLSAKYPSVIFLKVVVEQSRAAAENITTLPRFRLYKDGSRVGTATLDVLEIMIKDNLIDPI
ncbi:TPR repeat-containing thioredoxin TTL1-like [Solanum pennellii]|uniref:TPR repeat-containing thioredoxin TTL1-like n=1 Tax=Solanum pennellii TaxID=28526 RepID=A0ABM1FDM9_SOLPN|nr:TPR repeat-containing thioredoxin TTL1-like [Solanum pennellii]